MSTRLSHQSPISLAWRLVSEAANLQPALPVQATSPARICEALRKMADAEASTCSDQFRDDLAGFRGPALLGEGLFIDPIERHAVAGLGQEDGIAMQLKGSYCRAPEQMPAARRGQALDAGLNTANRDRSCWREYPRTETPRHMQGLVEP